MTCDLKTITMVSIRITKRTEAELMDSGGMPERAILSPVMHDMNPVYSQRAAISSAGETLADRDDNNESSF